MSRHENTGFSIAASAWPAASAGAAPARGGAASAESSGDIVIGAAVLGRREDLLRRADLHQLAQVHEGCDVRNARRLLQVGGDDGDAIALAQTLQRLLDAQRGDRT